MRLFIKTVLFAAIVFVIARTVALMRTGKNLADSASAAVLLPISLMTAAITIALNPVKWGLAFTLIWNFVKEVLGHPFDFTANNLALGSFMTSWADIAAGKYAEDKDKPPI